MTLTRTARITGALYLGLAISGMVSFLGIQGRLYDPDDAVVTTTNILENTSLARWGLVFSLGIVLTQALLAMAFFALFRHVNSFAAGTLAAFGLVNAIMILVATAFTGTALDVSLSGGLDESGTVQLLYQLSNSCWAVGSLFFGLWLIPMGYIVASSGVMPRPLGWILMAGGLSYVIAAFLKYAAGTIASTVAEVLPYVATIGEFWMLGYLLVFGIRTPKESS